MQGKALDLVKFFDTLKIQLQPGEDVDLITAARSRCLNLRHYEDGCLGISLDETVNRHTRQEVVLGGRLLRLDRRQADVGRGNRNDSLIQSLPLVLTEQVVGTDYAVVPEEGVFHA